MAQYQGRIAKLADKDNNTVVPITNARAVEVSKNRNLEAIVDKVDDMENVAQRVFNNSITPIITPIQTSVQRLDGIEAKANANTAKVNQLEQKQTSDKNELTNTMNGVKQNVQTIEGNVTNTSNTVTQHTQQITDLEYSVGEVLPKAEEAVAKVDGILGEKYIDCVAQGKMTQVGKQADGQVVAIDNSFAKEVMLKGQTLVNVLSRYNASLSKNGTIFETTNSSKRSLYLSTPSNTKHFSLLPNTKYLLQYEISNLNLDGVSNITLLFSEATLASGNCLFGESAKAFVSNNGVYKEVLTTTNLIDTSAFVIKGLGSEWESSGSATRSLKISNVILIPYQDGMENWDIPYFEGMASVKNPVVTSVGKNLYPDGDLILNSPKTNAWYYTNGAPCKYGEQCKRGDGGNWFYLPAGTYTFKAALENAQNSLSFLGEGEKLHATGKEVPGGWYVLRFKTKVEAVDYALVSNIQVEKKANSTTYEPYKSHTVSSTEEIILRSLPNGVCDTLNLLTGEYVQRIGEKRVDGTETWLEDTGQVKAKTHLFYSASIPNAKLLTSISERNFGVVCDNYIVWGNNYNDDIESVMINNSPRIYLRLSKEKATSVAKLKTYLTSNNFKIQYELATPIAKKVKLSNSPFMFKDGHIILSSANDLLPSLTYTTTVGIKGQVETLSNAVREIATNRQDIHDNQSLPVEKGSFLPRLVGEGGGVSRDYNAQEGSYQRIGNLVHIQLRIEVNDWYSCQGSFQIAGLPFASNNTYSSFTFGWASNLQTGLDNASLSAYMRPNTSGIALGFNEIKDGSRYYPIQNPNVADRDSSLDMAIAGTYMID